MTAGVGYPTNAEAASARRVGRYAALLTALMTIITFALAIAAVPISGANCVDGCIEYPYLNTVAQFPKDYRWMPAAMILVLVFLTLMAAIHAAAPAHKKVFSQIGLSFAIVSAVVL